VEGGDGIVERAAAIVPLLRDNALKIDRERRLYGRILCGLEPNVWLL
jgi:hypothetical protein